MSYSFADENTGETGRLEREIEKNKTRRVSPRNQLERVKNANRYGAFTNHWHDQRRRITANESKD